MSLPVILRGWRAPLLVAAVVRLAMIVTFDIANPNLWEYGNIARNLLNGHGYAMTWWPTGMETVTFPTAFMPPGPVMLQYLPLLLFGEGVSGYLAIFVAYVALGIAFVYVIGKITELLFHSPPLTVAALWSAALYPSFVYATVRFGSTNGVLLLNALVILQSLKLMLAVQHNTAVTRPAVQLGVALGLLAFFRAEAPLVLLAAALVLIWTFRSQLRLVARPMILTTVSMIAVLSPWIVRNYMTFDRVIVGSTSGGFNLWRGNNPMASGSSWRADGLAVWTTDTMWREILPAGYAASDVEDRYQQYHFEKASSYIAEDPARFVGMAVKKASLLWGVDWYSAPARHPIYILLYFGTIALALIGIANYGAQSRHGLAIALALCATITLVSMVFFSLPRFQVFLVGILFPYTGAGLAWSSAYIRQRVRPTQTAQPIEQPVSQIHDVSITL
jgi:hypothetical protein